MDSVEVSTVVYLPPEEVYEFLKDFPGYARYSKYLQEVRQDGDGSPGTRYALTFAWWKLTYTAVSEVTAVDPPSRIDWRVVSDLDADGHWRVEPADDEAPPDREHASRVWFTVAFDPDSATSDTVDLPRLVSLDWVVEKVKPLVREEAERIVERIVADLEGERRDVDLRIHDGPDDV
ncbi:type II toxin-antitoxin system RatA family toxin [Halomicrobium salinisoli]|uniref:type II toxin-antitoxin system RatA family toxin n=1 Tax=Halomicrobium salinisoli TaxID=2878391 RepID=UPI001CF0A66C|nr:SRPBCC family protein [Halomicrobium salinisoli]